MALALALLLAWGAPAAADTRDRVTIRGRDVPVHVYGQRGGPVAVVSSGDGGWVHLAPEVAELLAAQGWFVVGVDAKAYLSAFTSGKRTLAEQDVPGDYLAFVRYAAGGDPASRPLLVGVSAGAALSVLAATGAELKGAVSGVVGLGLPDQSELGWRWQDSLIYLTKGTPNEPMFSTAAVIARVAPLPVAAIHSRKDEYVPVEEMQRVMTRAAGPARVWTVDAENHRFSGNSGGLNRALAEAIAWIRSVTGTR
ncbi:MAG: alpha/beta hydrolase family protein [Vicinamibacterales bacterium]